MLVILIAKCKINFISYFYVFGVTYVKLSQVWFEITMKSFKTSHSLIISHILALKKKI